MAGASLLALIDKIAVVLDDVALMTKVAAKKTAGVLGDDLALNAQQVSGVSADRELPVVFAVAKGSAINKLILVPLALAASAFLPWLITPLLMLGGAYLCYEGFEKVWHSFVLVNNPEKVNAEQQVVHQELIADNVDLVALEQGKIKGAIRTDFILSAEIIVIALGTVQQATFYHQIIVVSAIATLMTVGVYGLVAAIVKLDDAGLYLLRSGSYKQVQQTLVGKLKRVFGRALLGFAPRLMRSLAVIGTIAMFLVGGSILTHGVPLAHHLLQAIEQFINQNLAIGTYAHSIVVKITPLVFDAVVGLIAGALVLLIVSLLSLFLSKQKK
jgi:predicted DNA repair protein MutK